ncbi:hypothetical protein I5M32_09970 [Pedobacter sp. SD-b]|uniref:DUF1330 domain-containing protein n=1 Tax=Pedobacter segetis TaxID=2793069 RepID=A0ABS1BKM0_9SPHI|nr:hypothetical protein [Pedobacter segetis]MBK0383286.1 hypothetical protein [Pedobacter segetis]
MIYLTQLIHIVPGQEKVFDQFEDIALSTIGKYNGRLFFRLRPDEKSFIEIGTDKPYEIHFLGFDTEQDFENFKKDKKRREFLHLKEQSIKTSLLIKGTKI